MNNELETLSLCCKSGCSTTQDYAAFFDDVDLFGIEIHDSGYGSCMFEGNVDDAKNIIDWLTRFVNSQEQNELMVTIEYY